MPITFRCTCGKKLQVSDEMAGTKVRCADCQSVVTVPGSVTPAAARVTAAPRRAEPEPPALARGRPRSARNSGGSSGLTVVLILGIIGVVLLGCLGVGGVAAYFIFSAAKSSPEATLVGEWELDPDNTPIIVFPMRLAFNADHTYQMHTVFDFDGTWQVTSHNGNKLKLTMTTNFMGWRSDRSSYPTVTIIDKDHIQFDGDQPGMQASNARFRRVGAGGSPATPLGPGIAGKPGPDRGKVLPGKDAGVAADCEVEWGGVWYKAKVMKQEKDRWFIHYIGYENHWDEWVTKERIRFLK